MPPVGAQRRVAQRGELGEAARADRVGDAAGDADEDQQVARAAVAVDQRRGSPWVITSTTPKQRDAPSRRASCCVGSWRVVSQSGERDQQRGGGDDQRRVLRAGVLERDVGEEVEAGEAERAEDEQLEAAAVGAQRLAALERGEQAEEDRGRDAVADRRQVEGVDVRDRGGGDREHRAPGERGGEGGEEVRKFDDFRTLDPDR